MANQVVTLIDNEGTNLYPVAGALKQSSVTTSTINDGAVTANKIDFTTFPFGNCSTSEVNTGFTWVDGSPIYKKTVNFGVLPNNTSKQVAHNIQNVDYFVGMFGVAMHSNKVSLPLPFVGSSSLSSSVALNANDEYVVVTTGSDRSDFTTTYVTLYYTKSS